MAKSHMRVHELAKELELSSKDLLVKLQELGVNAKNHMSSLDAATLESVRSLLAGGKAAAAPVPPEAVKPAPKPPSAPVAAPAPAAAVPVAPQPPHKAPSAKKAEPAKKAEAPAPLPPPAPTDSVVATPTEQPPQAAVSGKTITLKGPIVIKELADLLKMRPNQLIAELMMQNVLASINERLDVKVAQQIAEKHGFVVEREKKPEHHPVMKKRDDEEEGEDRPEDLLPRAPIVTFLGHVDHGKTSLLDKIRNATVAAGESGGITQHIGAYTVDVDGRSITFLDTPGHQAFTAMRARGANLTDIAVIIIAADDGIMPQTQEAIKHAQAAKVAIMVAINKIDIPGVNPERVKQQLAALNLTPEDWGGEVICCPVSALTGQGVDHLLAMILLQSEVLELKANPKRRAMGYVIEAQLEPGMGPTANLLVRHGTLSLGDAVLCGPYWGRVRALINDHGVKVKSAGPSTPIKCLGLAGVPNAGAEFRVMPNDRVARERAEENAQFARSQQQTAPRKSSLEALYQQLKDNDRLELRVILKADVQGSVEAIEHALREIKSDKVALNIIMSGVGNITTNDVLLASASNAVTLAFRVGREEGVSKLAKREGIEIRGHDIIYALVDEVQAAMAGMLAPILREKILGHAEVKKVFSISKGRVAGCMATDGVLTPRAKVRVLRGGNALHEGSVFSLRRFENDVSEVRESQECGIRLDNFNDFAEGDVLEFYEIERITQTL